MFSAEMLMKGLGIDPAMIEKYADGIAKGVQEIRAGISGLISSNAAIVARLDAIEARLTPTPPTLTIVDEQSLHMKQEENTQ